MEPWFVHDCSACMVSSIVETPHAPQKLSEQVTKRIKLTIYLASVPEGREIMLALFIVTAFLGLILFRRKDFFARHAKLLGAHFYNASNGSFESIIGLATS